jgi:hypothetical protein
MTDLLKIAKDSDAKGHHGELEVKFETNIKT